MLSRLNSDRFDYSERFFRLSAVNILSNLMVPLAGLIDIAFLGHLDDIKHLAGVALATVLFNYIYWTFGFLRMATTGTTAQAIGRNDHAGVIVTGLRNGAIALLAGLTILLIQHPLREFGFALLSATEEVKLAGTAYYNALIWGAPAALMNFVLMGWFLGKGRGSRVLVLSAVNNGVNVFFNYLFIVQFGWESAGAGAATAIAQYAMMLTGLGLVGLEVPMDKVRSLLPSVLDLKALKAAVLLNTNILIRTFAFISTFAVFTNLSSSMGTVVLATNTLLLQVVMLAAYFIDGVAFATESYAGMFRGSGEGEKLASLAQLAGIVSLIMGLAIALLFVGFPGPLFGLLTSHSQVVSAVQTYAWWLLPVIAFGSQAYMLDGYFLGLTEGKILRKAAVVAAFVGFAPMGAIAWYFQSSHLLWLALALFMAARAITLGLRLPGSFR
jgi:MATE family multidrug resistance protein